MPLHRRRQLDAERAEQERAGVSFWTADFRDEARTKLMYAMAAPFNFCHNGDDVRNDVDNTMSGDDSAGRGIDPSRLKRHCCHLTITGSFTRRPTMNGFLHCSRPMYRA